MILNPVKSEGILKKGNPVWPVVRKMVQRLEGIWLQRAGRWPDVFVHYSGINKTGFKYLNEGGKDYL